MLQNPCKTLGFKKNMVYKIPPGGGGGKPYPASGLVAAFLNIDVINKLFFFKNVMVLEIRHSKWKSARHSTS